MIRPPSGPLVLALEKDNKVNRGMPKLYCSMCSINQRCSHPNKVYQEEILEQETVEALLQPPRKQERGSVKEVKSEPSLTPASSTSSSASSAFGKMAIEVELSLPTPGSMEPSRFYPPLLNSDSEWDESEPSPPSPKPPH